MKRTIRLEHRKKPYFALSGVFFSGLLMIASKIGISAFISWFVDTVLKEAHISEWQAMLLDMAFYLLLFVPSAVFLMVFFRMGPLEPFAEKPDVPPLPYLYIPMAIGLTYAFNMLLNLLIGDLLAPLEPVQTPSEFPITPSGIALDFVYTAFLPAITEEWFFRGIAMRKLLPYGKGFAVVSSALLFGFMHGYPAQTLFSIFFGLIAGYTYLKTGSIWFGVLIHFVNNTISLAVSYQEIVFADADGLSLTGLYILGTVIFAIISLIFYYRSQRYRKTVFSSSDPDSLSAGQSAKLIFCNPVFYLVIAGYCYLLWVQFG